MPATEIAFGDMPAADHPGGESLTGRKLAGCDRPPVPRGRHTGYSVAITAGLPSRRPRISNGVCGWLWSSIA